MVLKRKTIFNINVCVKCFAEDSFLQDYPEPGKWLCQKCGGVYDGKPPGIAAELLPHVSGRYIPIPDKCSSCKGNLKMVYEKELTGAEYLYAARCKKCGNVSWFYEEEDMGYPLEPLPDTPTERERLSKQGYEVTSKVIGPPRGLAHKIAVLEAVNAVFKDKLTELKPSVQEMINSEIACYLQNEVIAPDKAIYLVAAATYKSSNLSQREISKKFGVTRKTLTKWVEKLK